VNVNADSGYAVRGTLEFQPGGKWNRTPGLLSPPPMRSIPLLVPSRLDPARSGGLRLTGPYVRYHGFSCNGCDRSNILRGSFPRGVDEETTPLPCAGVSCVRVGDAHAICSRLPNLPSFSELASVCAVGIGREIRHITSTLPGRRWAAL
jgi:hypothetical protein